MWGLWGSQNQQPFDYKDAPVAQLDRAAASEGAYRVDNKSLDGIATDLK
jgi:hypothetical protein